MLRKLGVAAKSKKTAKKSPSKFRASSTPQDVEKGIAEKAITEDYPKSRKRSGRRYDSDHGSGSKDSDDLPINSTKRATATGKSIKSSGDSSTLPEG